MRGKQRKSKKAAPKKAAPKKAAPKKAAPKKAAPKKAAPKPPVPPPAPTVRVPDNVPTAFARWKLGEALADLAKELGYPLYQTLRHHFIKLAGGHDAFLKLRAAGAGGQAKRVVGVPGQAPPTVAAMDDSKVPHIHHSLLRRGQGWSWRHVYMPVTVSVPEVGLVNWRELVHTIYTNPEGIEYVQATSRERADLLVDFSVEGLPSMRMRRFETSAARKEAKHQVQDLQHGLEAKAAKRQHKQAHEKKLARLAT